MLQVGDAVFYIGTSGIERAATVTAVSADGKSGSVVYQELHDATFQGNKATGVPSGGPTD